MNTTVTKLSYSKVKLSLQCKKYKIRFKRYVHTCIGRLLVKQGINNLFKNFHFFITCECYFIFFFLPIAFIVSAFFYTIFYPLLIISYICSLV